MVKEKTLRAKRKAAPRSGGSQKLKIKDRCSPREKGGSEQALLRSSLQDHRYMCSTNVALQGHTSVTVFFVTRSSLHVFYKQTRYRVTRKETNAHRYKYLTKPIRGYMYIQILI